MWKLLTANCCSAARRSEERLLSQQQNKRTKSVLLASLMYNNSVWVSCLFSHLRKHKTVGHSLTVIFLNVCSVCLAGLCLDSAQVKPESRQHLGTGAFSFALSLTCFMAAEKGEKRSTQDKFRAPVRVTVAKDWS